DARRPRSPHRHAALARCEPHPHRAVRAGASMTASGRVNRSAARNSSGAPGLPLAWHHQTEDEIAAAHEYGFLCGLRAESATMERALQEARDGGDAGADQ